jgi:hypothetical protein
MHPIGRFRRSWNNPGYGPQGFQKVGTGNKWIEYFNLTKVLDENAKIRRPIYAYRREREGPVILKGVHPFKWNSFRYSLKEALTYQNHHARFHTININHLLERLS